MVATLDSPTRSIRCGVFHSVEQADRVIEGLLAAGFSADQISVVCSEAAKEQHFRRFVHEEPIGRHTAEATTAGSIAGALCAGLATVGMTSGGIMLLATGPLAVLGGAVAGGLIGAMMTRAEEHALADFYDQALDRGDLLVGVEDNGPNQQARLEMAERVFVSAGTRPLPLESELEVRTAIP